MNSDTLSPKKIVVTGGAGYLGSILVPELLKRGYEVLVVDNFMYDQTPFLEWCSHPYLRIVRGDTRDRALMKGVLKDAHAIIPLGCLTGGPICEQDRVGARTINYESIKMITEERDPHTLIIFPSTQSVYGNIGEECTEITPPAPISHYAELKVEAEEMLLQAGNAIIFRLATVFGMSPRMRLDLVVNDFVYRAVVDRFVVLLESRFKRDYIYIGDVARAFLFALDNAERINNNIYNIKLHGVNLTKKELCDEIKKQIPYFVYDEIELSNNPDRRDYMVSSEKIESLGFKAEHPLEAGIEELIKGYQIVRRNQFSNEV